VIVKLTFKTPDVIDQALDQMADYGVLPSQMELAQERLYKWIKGGEYLTVEYDTDNDILEVVESK